jgi:branched-chain amino acid transport system substrate-binding protein
MVTSFLMKRVSVIFFLFFFIFTSCSHKKELIVEKVDISPEIKSSYNKLEESYNYGEYDSYLIDSDEFLKKTKDFSKFYYDVVLKRAKIYIEKKDFIKSKLELNKILKTKKYFNITNQAYLYYAFCEYKLNRTSDALRFLKYFDIDSSGLSKNNKKDYYLLKANMHKEREEFLNSMSSFIKAYEYIKSIENKSYVNSNIFYGINKLEINELSELLNLSRGKKIESLILYLYSERLFKEGNFQKSLDMFSYLIKLFPDSEFCNLASSYINKINNFKKVEPFNIGVVLPLTGRMAPYGIKSLNGIQLAINMFNSYDSKLKDNNIKIYLVDSKGDPNLAMLGFNKLLEEHNVSAIIGDLSNDSAVILSEKCENMKVTNFTLSNNNRLEEKNFNYLFNVTVGYKDQIDKLLWYAMDELSIKNFGILYPEDKYGKDLSSYFWNKVIEKGGKITSVQNYELGENDFKEEISKMFGLNSNRLRKEELEKMTEALKEKHKENYNPYKHEVKLSPVKSFDAIFIPDDAKVFSKIAPYFSYYDVENIIPLGPNTWNSNKLIKRGGKLVEGAIFVDAMSKKSLNENTKEFYAKFLDVFERYPGLIEAQAYDATNIIISSILSLKDDLGIQGINRENLNKKIYEIGEFKGATGNLKINRDGTTKKTLVILSVQRGRIIEIKNN